MLRELAELLLLIAPLVLGGVSNQLYLRLPAVGRWNAPLDAGRRGRDGAPLLGRNKTWQGLAGMVLLTGLWMAAVAGLARHWPGLGQLARLDYGGWAWPLQPLAYGALWGLAYGLAELPNSYLKRRLGIRPGANVGGLQGVGLRALDQLDSVAGCVLVLPVFYAPGLAEAGAILLLGGAVHYAVNLGLYGVGLKGQAG